MDRQSAPSADSMIIKGEIDRFNKTLDSTPAFYVLTTADNTRVTQLEAGKHYIESSLVATRYGLYMHPLSQALQEFPEMDTLYTEAKQTLLPTDTDPEATVQMLCRIGHLKDHGDLPGPSPRRGLKAHLQSVSL